ncbi:MAG: transporter C-terminal domain [Actinomycetota bacterium]
MVGSDTESSSLSILLLLDRELKVLHVLLQVGLEQLVAELEAKQAKLTTELADPATYSQGAKVQQLNADLKTTTDALQTATTDWEKAAQKLTDAKGA